MANLHLVTGYAGAAHVTAADSGSFNAAILGEGQYVLNRGNKFAASVITNNKIRISDGDILMQGRHIRLNEGETVDLTIENGASDYYRNDLIVARYTKNSDSGIEECNLVVIKGTAVTSNPADPEYTSGDIINDHVLQADMPLYRVPLSGLNVQTLVPLFTEINTNLQRLNEELNDTKGVILWETADETAGFPAQTVSLSDVNLLDYNAYYARFINEGRYYDFWVRRGNITSGTIAAEANRTTTDGDYKYIYSHARLWYIDLDNNAFVFDAGAGGYVGYAYGTSWSDNTMRPVAIYGYNI